MKTLFAALLLTISSISIANGATINGREVEVPKDSTLESECTEFSCILSKNGINFMSSNGFEYVIINDGEATKICDLAWNNGMQGLISTTKYVNGAAFTTRCDLR